MDIETIGIIFRGLERIIVVLAGTTAILLGYRLFFTVLSDRGSFEGSMGRWKVKLQRLAPGGFFALFGVVILAFAIKSPFQSSPPNVPNGGVKFGTAVGSDLNDSRKARQLLAAITSISRLLSTQDLSRLFAADDLTALAEALTRMTHFRDDLIDPAFGAGWRSKYYDYSERYTSPAERQKALSGDDLEIFGQISSIMGAKSAEVGP